MDCIILCRNVVYCPQNKLFLKIIGKLEMAAIGWVFLNTLFLKWGRCVIMTLSVEDLRFALAEKIDPFHLCLMENFIWDYLFM